MTNQNQQRKPLEDFTLIDHQRLNELLANLGSYKPEQIKFIQDLHSKREAYNRPKLTKGQRGYLVGLHNALVKAGTVEPVAA
jgi:hypothetical protein